MQTEKGCLTKCAKTFFYYIFLGITSKSQIKSVNFCIFVFDYHNFAETTKKIARSVSQRPPLLETLSLYLSLH